MKAPPPDFDTGVLERALHEHWGLPIRELEYVPLGFGGHHWRAVTHDGRAYFLTLNVGENADWLRQAFETARWLSTEGQLEFVVGPLPDRAGNVLRVVAPECMLSVAPWLDAQPAHDPHGEVTAGLLARLHRVQVPSGLVRTEDFGVPRRAQLEASLDDVATPWLNGPFGEPARELVRAHGDAIRGLLGLYDADVASTPRANFVVTHGEPYGPNLLQGRNGQLYLIDWDTVLLAPRERDLWELPGASGRPEVLRLYRAWYALAELAVYISLFHGPHAGDPNDAHSWANLHMFLPTPARWPELAF